MITANAHLPGDRDTLVDLGANVALASVYLTRRHGLERIVAVAPLPENADLARLNLAMNDISAEVVQVALAPRSGPATFVGVNNHSLGPVAPKGGELPVTLVTVDENAPEPVRLVKLDIEDGEGPRPTANTAWLDRTRGLIVEVHPAEVDYRGLAHEVRDQHSFMFYPPESVYTYTTDRLSRRTPLGTTGVSVRPWRATPAVAATLPSSCSCRRDRW